MRRASAHDASAHDASALQVGQDGRQRLAVLPPHCCRPRRCGAHQVRDRDCLQGESLTARHPRAATPPGTLRARRARCARAGHHRHHSRTAHARRWSARRSSTIQSRTRTRWRRAASQRAAVCYSDREASARLSRQRHRDGISATATSSRGVGCRAPPHPSRSARYRTLADLFADLQFVHESQIRAAGMRDSGTENGRRLSEASA